MRLKLKSDRHPSIAHCTMLPLDLSAYLVDTLPVKCFFTHIICQYFFLTVGENKVQRHRIQR